MTKVIDISIARVMGILLCLLITFPASAAIINFEAFLDGSQANAGIGTGSLATGSGTMILDDVLNMFSWTVTWTDADLSSDVINGHFHGPALPGEGAGVQFGINFGTNPAVGFTILSDAQEADLLAGLWYVNVHTVDFPGGEIRGQLNSVVPLPAAGYMLFAALVGLVSIKPKR